MHAAHDHASGFRDAARLQPRDGVQGALGLRSPAVGTAAPDERLAALVPRDEHVLTGRFRLSAFGTQLSAPMRLRFFLLLALAACTTQSRSPSPASSSVTPDLRDDMRLGPTMYLVEDARIPRMLRDIDPQRIHTYDSALVSF